MQKPTSTNIGAVATAGLASLCCVGPLVLTMIGVAGLGSAGLPFTIFEPYRPYLMVMTALFLSVGFYMAYRKQEESCGEDEACATPRSLKMGKVGLGTVTGLTGLMLAVPSLPVSGTSSVATAGAAEGCPAETPEIAPNFLGDHKLCPPINGCGIKTFLLIFLLTFFDFS